jgi:hypothetical protein
MVPLHKGSGTIGAVVVVDDNLIGTQTLAEHRFDQRCDVVFFVFRGTDYRNTHGALADVSHDLLSIVVQYRQ